MKGERALGRCQRSRKAKRGRATCERSAGGRGGNGVMRDGKFAKRGERLCQREIGGGGTG